MRSFPFFMIFLALAGLIAFYIAWRLSGPARFRRRWKVMLAVGIFCLLLLRPFTFLLRRYGVDETSLHSLLWTGYLLLGFLSFVFTFLVIRDLVMVPMMLIRRLKHHVFGPRERAQSAYPDNPDRRRFLAKSMNYGIMTAASMFTLYGYAEANRTPGVREVVVPIKGLPHEFEGFRIVQITDIHVSQTIRQPFVEKVVQVINRIEPDVVVVTGDLANEPVERVSQDVAPLEQIRPAIGKFFVTGNHEYYNGVTSWVEKVEQLGFQVLLNEHRVITRGSGRLLLAGVTDYRSGRFRPGHRSDPFKAISGAPTTNVKILLAHQPKNIFGAAEAGFDLQISGHTHGGQFFPWQVVASLNQPFISGLHQYMNTQIYVSRGTGYWGPPLRVGSPSEITLIKLASRKI